MTAWDALAAQRDGVPVLQCGHVWLAGAGPGNPGSLTLDALAGPRQTDSAMNATTMSTTGVLPGAITEMLLV